MVTIAFYAVRPSRSDPLPSTEYDLWEFDQRAKEYLAERITDVKFGNPIEFVSGLESPLRLDARSERALATAQVFHPLAAHVLSYDGMVVVFSAAAAAASFLRAIRPIAEAWIKARENRNISVVTSEGKVTVKGDYGVEEALRILDRVLPSPTSDSPDDVAKSEP